MKAGTGGPQYLLLRSTPLDRDRDRDCRNSRLLDFLRRDLLLLLGDFVLARFLVRSCDLDLDLLRLRVLDLDLDLDLDLLFLPLDRDRDLLWWDLDLLRLRVLFLLLVSSFPAKRLL